MAEAGSRLVLLDGRWVHSCGASGGNHSVLSGNFRIDSAALNLAVRDDRLRLALEWADRIGEAAGQKIIVDSGTLLGLVREGRLLEHDIDFDLTVAGAAGIDGIVAAMDTPFHSWRFKGSIYKVEVPMRTRGGPPIPADIKIFTRHDGAWVSPSIGVRTQLAAGRSADSSMRGLLRPAWRRLVSRMDAGKAPLKWFTRIDSWVVPSHYFEALVPIAGMTSCYVPAQLEAYLEFRYGDWRKPRKEWSSRLDDGAYRPVAVP